ncbi:unnamed protein product [Gongylonema pulchrum]|uniref:GLTSCR1 domain-containing protein n=1 Tax=Gongylonema pulchrum TaxID=637853 RepID=A0A183DTV0_9BILA|nr:unnamed protein product [Gongylonema pulchrum]
MMSSGGYRSFDDLTEQYEDEWLQLGLEDDNLKCSSPPANGSSDFGLTVGARSCPSPLTHIPTRESYPVEPPPKLSPVSSEQQTFITLSNSRIPPVPSGPSQPLLQPPPQTQSSELGSIEYELNPDLNVLSIPSSSPMLVAKTTELQFAQPSVSGLQQNGDFASFVQLEQREKRTVIQPQQQQPGCVQTANGQWFVQAQLQQVQTSGGTVLAVVPNFCRSQVQISGNNQNLAQVQVSQPQLIAHSLDAAGGGSQATQHVLQTHPAHHQQQLQQQPQQIVHATRMPLAVAAGAPQQGQSVMQHLLSQPTISRPHLQATVQPLTSAPAAKKRNPQPRNGRKKKENVVQSSTVGAVLTKANKIAAAALTDTSVNQVLHPSHSIEMRLSVQNSELVANLSREITRLQNQQRTYRVDYSAEIKELESKRAQIFFDALAQQHKDKELLLAVNPKLVTSAVPNRQRSNNSHAGANAVIIHQVQPSTSYEQQPQQQQQPTFGVPPARVPTSYQNSYHLPHYTSAHETVQNNSFSASSTSQLQQGVSSVQYNSYRSVNQIHVQQGQVRENYVPNSVPQKPAIAQQPERCVSRPVMSEAPCEPPRPAVRLFPPPALKSLAEAAADIAKKKAERTERLKDYFSSVRDFVVRPDLTSPFRDLSDMLQRLLPFHVYSEPDLNSGILDDFDYDCLRHFVHLKSRRDVVEQRIRSILYREAMECSSKPYECLLLSLDAEHERRLLDEEKQMALITGSEEFVSKSAICAHLTFDELERRKKELVPGCMPTLHFDYHDFSEDEIIARTISLPSNLDECNKKYSKSVREHAVSTDADEEGQEATDSGSEDMKSPHSGERDAACGDSGESSVQFADFGESDVESVNADELTVETVGIGEENDAVPPNQVDATVISKQTANVECGTDEFMAEVLVKDLPLQDWSRVKI